MLYSRKQIATTNVCGRLIAKECRSEIAKRRDLALHRITRAASSPNDEAIAVLTAEAGELITCAKLLLAFDKVAASLEDSRDQNTSRLIRIGVSALTLFRTRDNLHNGALSLENLFLLTGPHTADGTRVLSEIVPVRLKTQSSSYVLADPDDCHKTICDLAEKDGHEVHAIVHSHMTKGEASSQPSQVDIAAQKRVEAIGAQSIGGIFTPDGFVCFYSVKSPFSLNVHGHGVAAVSVSAHRVVLRLEDR